MKPQKVPCAVCRTPYWSLSTHPHPVCPKPACVKAAVTGKAPYGDQLRKGGDLWRWRETQEGNHVA